MKMLGINIVILLIALPVYGEVSPLEYSRNFKEQLDEVKDLAPEEFLQSIDSYRESLEKYIEHKKRVCNGEFSTIILGVEDNEKKLKKKKRNKLSREERTLCFRELKGFQVTLVNNVYVARKRFLNYLHQKRIEELEATRIKTIDNLQKAFSKGQGRR